MIKLINKLKLLFDDVIELRAIIFVGTIMLLILAGLSIKIYPNSALITYIWDYPYSFFNVAYISGVIINLFYMLLYFRYRDEKSSPQKSCAKLYLFVTFIGYFTLNFIPTLIIIVGLITLIISSILKVLSEIFDKCLTKIFNLSKFSGNNK